MCVLPALSQGMNSCVTKAETYYGDFYHLIKDEPTLNWLFFQAAGLCQ